MKFAHLIILFVKEICIQLRQYIQPEREIKNPERVY